jgi:hypothetical protein
MSTCAAFAAMVGSRLWLRRWRFVEVLKSASRMCFGLIDREIETGLGRALFRAGMSDTELSRRSGVSRSRINLIKNRRVTATLRESLLFARLLGRDVDELFRLFP